MAEMSIKCHFAVNHHQVIYCLFFVYREQKRLRRHFIISDSIGINSMDIRGGQEYPNILSGCIPTVKPSYIAFILFYVVKIDLKA